MLAAHLSPGMGTIRQRPCLQGQTLQGVFESDHRRNVQHNCGCLTCIHCPNGHRASLAIDLPLIKSLALGAWPMKVCKPFLLMKEACLAGCPLRYNGDSPLCRSQWLYKADPGRPQVMCRMTHCVEISASRRHRERIMLWQRQLDNNIVSYGHGVLWYSHRTSSCSRIL
jgi:hypothetical protein